MGDVPDAVAHRDPSGPADVDVAWDEHVVLTPAERADRDGEFTAFAEQARDVLGRTAWLLTGDVHLAAELVQTALVKTYVAWPRAREGDPVAYARRVLANARIDLWRRRRREVLAAPDAIPEPTVRHRVARDHAARVDDRDQLVRALAVLGPRQRRVVVLRYLVGLTEREVAEDLGVTVGTVKTQASRGLRRLRVELGETSEEEVPDAAR